MEDIIVVYYRKRKAFDRLLPNFVRMRQPVQDNLSRTACLGQPVWNSLSRTACPGQGGGVRLIEKPPTCYTCDAKAGSLQDHVRLGLSASWY